MNCRVLPYAVANGPTNMAADETLLETAVAGGSASLRFYGWTTPTLSLGYFQPANLRLADPLLAALPYVRRPSGGDALVHHHELTYALALPAGLSWQKRGESWVQRMHAIVRAALDPLGVSMHVCCTGEEKQLGPFLCFLHQTPCDLLIGPHKVVGSAQRKSHGALLQHGAILLAQSAHTPALPGLHELAGFDPSAPSCAHLRQTLLAQFARDTGWQLEPSDWTPGECRQVAVLAAEKYGSTAWNAKR
jgi:lipoyl(octanoyl) transferase